MQKQEFFNDFSTASISGLMVGYIQSTCPPFGSPLIGRTYQAETLNGYRFGFNGKEKDNETYGDGNEMDFGARIYDSRLGRWLSVDPLTNKFPNMSPYAFGLNSPIVVIDGDGRENIIYLVVLPSAEGEFSKQDAEAIRDKANASLSAMGINAKVVIWTPKTEGETFDPRFKDATDHIVVLGEEKEVASYMSTHNQPDDISDLTECNSNDKQPCPEISELPGDAIALSSKALTCENSLFDFETDKNTFAAFTILHGLGHNAGLYHDDALKPDMAIIMQDGAATRDECRGFTFKGAKTLPIFSEFTSLSDFLNNNPTKDRGPRNQGYVNAVNAQFSKEAPVDNYGKLNLQSRMQRPTDTNNTDKTGTANPPASPASKKETTR